MFKLLLVVVVVTFVQGATYREIQDIEPGEPHKCKDNGKYYGRGVIWFPRGKCLRKECSYYSKKQVEIVWATCGVVGGLPKRCIESDLTQEYPQCCPKPKEDCN